MTPMLFQTESEKALTRRAFLARSTTGLGAIALSALLRHDLLGAAVPTNPSLKPKGALPSLHLAPKAKRVIYLFQSGAPSHIDLFDPKSKLTQMTGEGLPPSVRKGQGDPGKTPRQKPLLSRGHFPGKPRPLHARWGVLRPPLLRVLHRSAEGD